MSQVYGDQIVPSCQVYGNGGLGVLGAAILATTGTGADGQGYLYSQVQPGDEGKEFQGRILAWPTAGVFFPYADGSFSFSGAPDGVYSFTFEGKADGVIYAASVNGTILKGVAVYRPGSDVSVAGWTATPSGPLYDCIDEVSPGDADYITSPNLSSGQQIIFGLTASLAAGAYMLRVRAKYSGVTGQLRVTLQTAGGVDVGSSGWQALTAVMTNYEIPVTASGTAARVKIEVQ